MRRLALALAAGALAAGGGAAPAAAQDPPPPMVLVIFDALPVKFLQTPNGEIDAVRFPNFAAFAGDATWYRNATTIHESTRFSIPSILDARIPRAGQAADWKAHPDSIFTRLRGRYRMNVWEDASQVCPPDLCRRQGNGDVIHRLAFGRVERFRSALRRISGGSAPQLTVIHTMFPHEPRQYLPDGRKYQRGRSLDPALDGPASYHRRFLTEQALQRTLLQLEFTDRLVGELVAKLKREGLWNRAAVALLSDHGESFQVKRTPAGPFQIGKLTFRRAVTPSNIDHIAGVPLFVKYPGQERGREDQRYVRTIDAPATLLDLAGAGAGLDGRSLRDDSYRGQSTISVRKQEGGAVTIAPDAWRQRVERLHRQRIRLFGSAGDSLFDFGPRRDLNGRPVSELPRLPRSRLRASLVNLRPATGTYVPAHLVGRLAGPRPGGRVVALAVDGVIAATAPTYRPLGKLRFSFAAMLPPDVFRRGRNRVEVFEVVGGRLRPL